MCGNGTRAAGGASYFQEGAIIALKMLSSEIGKLSPRTRLSPEERQELLNEVTDLLTWLRESQLKDHLLIREALIQGLEELEFRIARLEWVGWGYTLGSLKEVIAGYLMLERTNPNPGDNPDVSAVMKKVESVVKAVSESVGIIKDAAEKGEFVASAYIGCVKLIGNPVVASAVAFLAGKST